MVGHIVDLASYRQRLAQTKDGTAVADRIDDQCQKNLSESINFRTWSNDERVTKETSLMVQTSLARLLEAFQVNRVTYKVGQQRVKLPLDYQLLMVEGLTLRDFERLTVKRLSTILDVRLRVTEERNDGKPFLQYIILDKLRVITSPR